MALDVDLDRVVASRRARVCTALRDVGVDVFVVGRPVNLVHLTGARRVLVRGSRPFAPLAVLVPGTGELFVQSATGGVAPHVYAQSWNPRNVASDLSVVPALVGATRVGVDGMTPGWDALLHELAPNATVVTIDDVLRDIRTVKTPDELVLLRRAVDLALAGYSAVVDALHPGASERELRACFAATVARLGVTTLPHEAIVAVLADDGTLGRLPRDTIVRDGDRVLVDVGVVVDGYEAGVARTLRCGDPASVAPPGPPDWPALRDAVVAACRPGATGGDLDAAARRVAARDEHVPLAYGYGFGPEPPLGPDKVLAEAGVVAVQARVHAGFARDMVLVAPDGGIVLTAGADATSTSRHTTASA